MWDAIVNFWQFHSPIFSILLPAFSAFALIVKTMIAKFSKRKESKGSIKASGSEGGI